MFSRKPNYHIRKSKTLLPDGKLIHEATFDCPGGCGIRVNLSVGDQTTYPSTEKIANYRCIDCDPFWQEQRQKNAKLIF